MAHIEPDHPSPPRRRPPSRRGFLLGSGLVVVGAAAGITAGTLVDRSPEDAGTVPRPDVLLAAAAAERALLADLDATLRSGPGSSPTLLRRIRANHAAHLAALTSSLALAVGAPPSSAPPRAPRGAARDTVQLRRLEGSAADAAAQRAGALTGRDAVLLASIAACEATHAELLG